MNARARTARWSRTACLVACAALVGALGCDSGKRRPPAGAATSTDGVPLSPAAAKGWNLLLITLDTVRADHLGCYGRAQAETPTIDALAARGALFEHALTPVPITLPSHATILTGLLPPDHGVRLNGVHHLDPSVVTLAERLGPAGYATAAFVSASVLDRSRGLDQGFDTYDDPFSASHAGASRSAERSAADVTASALAWLGQRRDKPFFAWVHYFDAHDPYSPPAPYSTTHAGEPYDGEIAYVDHELGRLIAFLDTAGLRARTLVVVTADHGEGLGEHGERTHAHLLYESTTHVPLIVAPGDLLPRPCRVPGRIVSTADIEPTVLALLGVAATPARPASSGVPPRPSESLLASTSGVGDDDRAVYLETLWPYLMHGWAPIYGVARLRDKLVFAPVSEYYDLAADPGETKNLLEGTGPSSMPPRAEELQQVIAAAVAAQGAVAPREVPDAETVERLHSLGYLAGEAKRLPTGDVIKPVPLRDMIGRWQARSDSILASASLQTENMVAMQRRAVSLDPKNPIAHEDLGNTFMFLKRFAEAEGAFRAAVALNSKRADAWLKLAESQGAQQDWSGFDGSLAEARKAEPGYYGVPFLSGRRSFAQGRLREALASLEEARGKAPASEVPAIDGWIQRVRQRLEGQAAGR